jgi:hypothetical protein
VPAALRQDGRAGLAQRDREEQAVLPGEAARARLHGAVREAERRPARRGQQDLLRHHLVHEARLLRARRLQRAPGQDEVERRRDAHEARQPLGAARARDEPELDLGHAEHRLRIVGRDAVAAGQRHLEPAAERRAVDGRHHREGQRFQPVEDGLSAARQRLRLDRAADLAEVADVGAGDEAVGLSALQHDRADAQPALDLARATSISFISERDNVLTGSPARRASAPGRRRRRPPP